MKLIKKSIKNSGSVFRNVIYIIFGAFVTIILVTIFSI